MSDLDWQPYPEDSGQVNRWPGWHAESFVGTYHIEDQTSAGGDWVLTAIVKGELYISHFSGNEAEKRAYDRAEELEVQACG